MEPTEAAWVAGIIEGEGCIVWYRDQARIQVKMTDHDVIERLQAWTGLGTVREEKRPANRKRIWKWVVGPQEDFLALAEQIEPYLLARRAARLREVRASLLLHREGVAERAALRSSNITPAALRMRKSRARRKELACL